MPQPRISIIMPAFNAEAFIARSIESVLAQTCPDWELLVLDDGSTDHTATVVEQFTDPRIRLIKLPHIGVISKIRNIGLQEATGEFIAFLDADDLYENDALELLSRHLEQHPEVTAVHGYFRWINERDEFIDVKTDLTLSTDMPRYTWQDILGAKIPTWLQGLMFRRNVLSRVNSFNEEILINEDYLFFLELFLDNFEGVHSLPVYVFRYRNYQNSVTKTAKNFERILANQAAFFDYLLQHPGLRDKWPQCDVSGILSRFIYAIAIIRLRHGQPENARTACIWAWKNSHIRNKDWFRIFFPIMALSFIPVSMLETTIQLRKKLKSLLSPKFANTLAPQIAPN
ncbi:MAG: glycosyltransferase [Vampirovibrio sp.]|nr:glycosyltransferase [Vampirovibrio sp.]